MSDALTKIRDRLLTMRRENSSAKKGVEIPGVAMWHEGYDVGIAECLNLVEDQME